MTRARIILIVLMLWGLAMIVPDLLRVVQPLGSFGFYADSDGLIYNVTGPFASLESELEHRGIDERTGTWRSTSLTDKRPTSLPTAFTG